MMSEIEHREAGSGADDAFVTPADRLISNLDGTYFKLSEAAKILNTSATTLRRLMKNPAISAPSYQVRQGQMYMYLYTPEDLKELKAYVTPTPEKRNSAHQDKNDS